MRDANVLADATRLQQVLWNLLSNAVKFTPDGGRISVSAAQVDERIRIDVADTGIGIEPAFLPHVFDRFRQADSATTRRYGGLGLGLAIVHDLVRLHGGEVEVRQRRRRAWGDVRRDAPRRRGGRSSGRPAETLAPGAQPGRAVASCCSRITPTAASCWSRRWRIPAQPWRRSAPRATRSRRSSGCGRR